MDTSKELQTQRSALIKDTYAKMGDEERPVFLARKAEKLASAIYRVTELIHNNDPVKWKVRDAALDLVVAMVSIKETGKVSVLYRVDAIDKITSLLEISHIGSYVSKMNLTILSEEYTVLRELIIGPHINLLLETHFEVTDHEVAKIKNKRDFIEKFTTSQNYKGHEESARDRTPKVTPDKIDKNIQKKKRYAVSISRRPSEDKDKRQALMIAFIKDNGEVSIKDILRVQEISNGVSSKTIQRELTTMVENEILSKSGERRWSKYALH